jgi:molybdenum cofactor cytidylyltransferase
MIAAIVLAAGRSERMGQPKMILPWGPMTVIGQVARVLLDAGVDDVIVVTGGARREVEAALIDLPVRTVFNPDYANGEMLKSLQVGLAMLSADHTAALVTLGDQPQIRAKVVAQLLQTYRQFDYPLIVPSFEMRRGHPWLIARSLWPKVMTLKTPVTLRDFLNAHGEQIHYLAAADASVLADLDTPQDYQGQKPDLKRDPMDPGER